MSYRIHESSFVDENAKIGDNTAINHFSVVKEGAVVGKDCIIGQGCLVAENARIGNGVELQNHISVYDGVTLEDNVFCGAGCKFTNVLFPRREFPPAENERRTTHVERGATLGAGSILLPGNTIGEYALVGPGSLVANPVPAHALVVGVPAIQKGWVCTCGAPLVGGNLVCSCGRRFALVGQGTPYLVEVDSVEAHGRD